MRQRLMRLRKGVLNAKRIRGAEQQTNTVRERICVRSIAIATLEAFPWRTIAKVFTMGLLICSLCAAPIFVAPCNRQECIYRIGLIRYA
jgi:hypothetical protein